MINVRFIAMNISLIKLELIGCPIFKLVRLTSVRKFLKKLAQSVVVRDVHDLLNLVYFRVLLR